MNWSGRRVLVTGGASFIGSHLTEALIRRGARVRVADNMSSGTRERTVTNARAEAVRRMESSFACRRARAK